jgi:Secretion system C-terminal sorting domain
VYDTLSTIADTLDAHMVSCGAAPRNLSGLEIGRDYWYRVYTPGSAPAELCLFGTWVQDQSNDEATGAVELTYADAYSHYFTTTGATQSLPGADCSTDDTADDDIWFRFTATDQPARVVVSHGTADLTLEVFSGTPGNLTSLACSDNVLVLPTLTSGQVYYVRLYSWRNAVPVEGRLGIFVTPSLTANTCVDETCLGPVLLANPSIEQGAYCQAGVPSILDMAGLGIPLAPGWPRMHGGSSDGYSSCTLHDATGEMPAQIYSITLNRTLSRSGKGMAGSLAWEIDGYREYIQAPLTEPLTPGEPYLVSFNVVLADAAGVKVNGLGALLSVGPMVGGSYAPFNAEPQVVSFSMVEKGGWTNICGIVVPDAPWDNIAIGSFFADREAFTHVGNPATSSYHFYDDIVVARINDPGCITSIGDVPPLDESTSSKGDALRVYPNPANELLNIVADASLFGQRAVIEVFDATGSRVHAEQVNYFNAVQPLDLSSEWCEGLYLVLVCVEGQEPRSARVVVRR